MDLGKCTMMQGVKRVYAATVRPGFLLLVLSQIPKYDEGSAQNAP